MCSTLTVSVTFRYSRITVHHAVICIFQCNTAYLCIVLISIEKNTLEVVFVKMNLNFSVTCTLDSFWR